MALTKGSIVASVHDELKLTKSKSIQVVEPHQRAHSPQLAAGLASESKKWLTSLRSKIPCSLLQGSSITSSRQFLS